MKVEKFSFAFDTGALASDVCLNSVLLNKMTDGVVLLDNGGRIYDYNRAALPWLSQCERGQAELAEGIRKISCGAAIETLLLSSVFEILAPKAEFYLCQNGSRGYVIFITVCAPVTVVPMSKPHEVQPLFVDELRQKSCAAHPLGPFDLGERIVLQDLIQQVVSELPEHYASYHLSPSFDVPPEKKSIVFGQAGWLKVAIKTLLEVMNASLIGPADADIRLSNKGDFLYLSVAWHLAPSLVRTCTTPVASDDLSKTSTDELRVDLARRIIELHGGQLEVDCFNEQQVDIALYGPDSFALTLPTGSPRSVSQSSDCANCLFPKQAEMYARDFALLLPHRQVDSAVSNDELEYLAQLTSSIEDLATD